MPRLPPHSPTTEVSTDDEEMQSSSAYFGAEETPIIASSPNDGGSAQRGKLASTIRGSPFQGFSSPSDAGSPKRSQPALFIDLSSTYNDGTGADSSGRPAAALSHLPSLNSTSNNVFANTLTWLQHAPRYMTASAKLMTLMAFIGTLLTTGISAAVIIAFYTDLRTFVVADGSVCDGAHYEEIKTNSLGYSVSIAFVGCLYAMWMVIRTIRLEKTGLLIVANLVIVATVSRMLYFAFEIAPKTLNHRMEVAAQVAYTLASVVLLVALGCSVSVMRSFGWRVFSRGVTQVEDVHMMQRYKQLDACAKLDLYITINAFVSLFFFVSELFLRIYGFIVTAITIVLLVALNVIVKRRRYWALYLFYVVCVLMPVFYIYTLTSVALAGDSVCPQDRDECLRAQKFSVREGPECAPPQVAPCAVRQCNGDSNATTPDEQQACEDTAEAAMKSCCSEYGRCGRKRVFFDSDQPLVIFLAVVGCLVRAVTVYLGFRQSREMGVPSVQEMMRRGETHVTEALRRVGGGAKAQQPHTAVHEQRADPTCQREPTKGHLKEEDDGNGQSTPMLLAVPPSGKT